MSTSEDPGTSPSRRDEGSSGAPEPGAAPEPGTSTGLSAGEESRAGERSAARQRDRGESAGNMLPGRSSRRFGLERILARFIATAGVVGIGVALGAILVSSKVQGWITGLVVATVSVVLSGMLWSSRQL